MNKDKIKFKYLVNLKIKLLDLSFINKKITKFFVLKNTPFRK